MRRSPREISEGIAEPVRDSLQRQQYRDLVERITVALEEARKPEQYQGIAFTDG